MQSLHHNLTYFLKADNSHAKPSINANYFSSTRTLSKFNLNFFCSRFDIQQLNKFLSTYGKECCLILFVINGCWNKEVITQIVQRELAKPLSQDHLIFEENLKAKPQVLLIANRNDLKNTENFISYAEGKEIAEKIGAVGYHECSSKTENEMESLLVKITKIVCQEELNQLYHSIFPNKHFELDKGGMESCFITQPKIFNH